MTGRSYLRACCVGLATLLALTACTDVPRPFKPLEGDAIPLPETPSTLGIGVLPVSGLTEPIDTQFAEKVAEALRDVEFPAEAVRRAEYPGFSLVGEVSEPAGPNGTQATIKWALNNKAGLPVHQFQSVAFIAQADLEGGGNDEMDRAAQDVAAQITAILSDQVPIARVPALPGTGITVRIQPPIDSPGDGDTALVRVLANRLMRQGFEPAAQEPDFVIAGSVSVTAYDSVQDDIAIVWQVADRSGQALGDVRLDNRIPKGALDGGWGMVAEAVVDSAFPGLLDIIMAARTRNQ